MAHDTYIGIDNGTTGSIGVINRRGSRLYKTPIKNELNYTKAKKFINRVDGEALKKILEENSVGSTFLILERPMIDPMRWVASVSAIRCLEATLIVIENLSLSYIYADSRDWQSVMLPSGLVKDELKKASLQIGKRLFSKIDFKGYKDADSLLMAEYCKRKGL